MSLSTFTNITLVLTLFYTWVYYNASIFLNDRIEERLEISELKTKIKKLDGQKQLLSYQIDDLSYQLTGSTQVLSSRRPASVDLAELSLQRFESAKQIVRNGDLERALRILQEIPKKFPRSPILSDVHLLMGDIQRSREKYIEAVEQYENLVELYPDRVQAGIALFRLGEISEKNKNFQEAKAYFQIVQTQFSTVEELGKNSSEKIKALDVKLAEIENSGGL